MDNETCADRRLHRNTGSHRLKRMQTWCADQVRKESQSAQRPSLAHYSVLTDVCRPTSAQTWEVCPKCLYRRVHAWSVQTCTDPDVRRRRQGLYKRINVCRQGEYVCQQGLYRLLPYWFRTKNTRGLSRRPSTTPAARFHCTLRISHISQVSTYGRGGAQPHECRLYAVCGGAQGATSRMQTLRSQS